MEKQLLRIRVAPVCVNHRTTSASAASLHHGAEALPMLERLVNLTVVRVELPFVPFAMDVRVAAVPDLVFKSCCN